VTGTLLVQKLPQDFKMYSKKKFYLYKSPITRRWGLTLLLILAAGPVSADQPTSHTNTLSGHIQVIDRMNNPIEDASEIVVFIEGIDEPKTQDIRPAIKMSHQDKQFSPKTLPLRKGDSIDFLNDDTIFHNVFSLSKAKPFDLGIYPQGSSKVVTFDKTGLVKIYCNLHPKMVANILVLNNRFYTLTDQNGYFEINGLPEGRYTLRVWHELSSQQAHSISIKHGHNTLDGISVKLTKRFIQHKNKFGKKYKEKY
jgi:plastocyanin